MAIKIARDRLNTALFDWRRQLPLAGGTLLLLLGVFCAWQTWLIADEAHAIEQVHLAQGQVVRALTDEVSLQRGKIEKVLAAADPSMGMDDPAKAAGSFRQQLPEAEKLELYLPDLSEVLHADYHQFGYAKAAQLMAAQSSEGKPLAQSIFYTGMDRRLSMVVPLGPQSQPRAWVWVEWPFALLTQRFDAASPAGGRLTLRQGNNRNDVVLLSNGVSSATDETTGTPVAGSTFSVVAALPKAFIVLPRSWLLSALLALLGVAGGLFLLWLRRHQALPTLEEHEIMHEKIETIPAAAVPPIPVVSPPAPTAPAPVSPVFSVDPSIFRAYDIRGIVGKTLSSDVARALGQSIGTMMKEKGLHEMVVGRDGRLSGPELAAALAEGLRAAGVDVIDIGAVPTPLVYYAAFHFHTGCGVAVTGSHNPPDYNGFKIVVGGETLAEDAIQDLYRRIATGALDSEGHGTIRHVDVIPNYIERVASDVQAERPLKIVVDCGNGIAGAVAPQLLESVGCEVIPLYCDVDGTFPNHHPDPSDPHNLEDLILSVQKVGADLGIAFDGDADRLGVVTRSGEIIFPDRILMLFARDVLSRQPGATIIYDVKCTGYLKGQILDAGGSPLMWRTGHSLIKAKMRETNAELAGEMSGHFFFKERWYGFDDGIYAGARLLEILAGDPQGRTPQEIFDTLPKSVSTPELKIELAEGEHYAFMEKFRQQAVFPDATLITIDGVRADWPNGWGLVRASNTTPVLVLRFEADDAATLKHIQQIFRKQLLAVDYSLKIPF